MPFKPHTDFSLEPREEFKKEEKEKEELPDSLSYKNLKYDLRTKYPDDWPKREEEKEGTLMAVWFPYQDDLAPFLSGGSESVKAVVAATVTRADLLGWTEVPSLDELAEAILSRMREDLYNLYVIESATRMTI